MNFNEHSKLKGQHAFLGASKYHWLNYDEEKLIATYRALMAAQKGVKVHAFASDAIELGEKLPRKHKTLNMYVNDAIGFKMKPEQTLVYSSNCFGTADAISFRNGTLRIHDLKTGTTPVHMEQLLIYAALFCLEYGIRPGDIETELRLYWMDDVIVDNPGVETIAPIMDKIITFDTIINDIRGEELS